MTELEKMQRAKMYIDKLAQGINPLDDTTIPEDEVINNVRLSRCLFYVSDILRQVIDNGGQTVRKNSIKKEFFTLTDEQKDLLIPEKNSVTIKDMTDKINSLIDQNTTKKFKATSIADWLVSIDLLEILKDTSGRNIKRPTQDGKMLGIFCDQRMGQYGPYVIVCYPPQAQQFIYDNIDALIQFNNSTVNTKENKNMPWTAVQDEVLKDLSANGATVKEMALALKRTNTGIRSRLIVLGLGVPEN